MYSVDAAPRWPELKLSMYRTQRCSRGTVVPPDVTHTTLLGLLFPAVQLRTKTPHPIKLHQNHEKKREGLNFFCSKL